MAVKVVLIDGNGSSVGLKREPLKDKVMITGNSHIGSQGRFSRVGHGPPNNSCPKYFN